MTKDHPKESIAYATLPDERFREIIGDISLSELFTPEKIQAAQQVVDDARGAFFITLQPMVDEVQMVDPHGDFGPMIDAVHIINNQARLLGFTFIFNISNHLLELCNSADYRMQKSQALMENLIKVLKIAFSEKIQDDGGKMGEQLLASLSEKSF